LNACSSFIVIETISQGLEVILNSEYTEEPGNHPGYGEYHSKIFQATTCNQVSLFRLWWVRTS
jgi:hypothetical protein